ncbi:hypothetical protein ACKKBG_A15520 [Auxenochlorella protothecoides x Auxenochlorella symbiontica]
MKFSAVLVLALAVATTASPLIVPHEELCSDKSAPVAGGFSPASLNEPATLEVFEAIADEFILTHNTTVTCDDFVIEPLKACSQVVAGTNYEVIMHIICPVSDTTITVYGSAHLPLPVKGGRPLIVGEVEQVPE